MRKLTEDAHAAVRTVLQSGETAIDATAGNGHDTRFLAELVGPTGRVFAFDVQPAALARTSALLESAGLANVTLLERDHAEIAEAVAAEFHGRIGAVMFNLGYLPGGDKAVTTRTATTIAAVRAAIGMLRPGGVLTVIAYPGHPGGAAECDAVRELLADHRATETPCGATGGPVLFVAIMWQSSEKITDADFADRARIKPDRNRD